MVPKHPRHHHELEKYKKITIHKKVDENFKHHNAKFETIGRF